MTRISRRAKLAFALLLSFSAFGCSDEIPTVLGTDPRLTTVEIVVSAADFLEPLGEFSGFSGVRDATFLLVANRFDGVLFANTLARFTSFPSNVTFSQGGASRTDSVFTFVGGRVVARVDTLASAATGPVTFRLWTVAQEWDPGSVSWRFAVDTAGVQIPWSQPGGTPGRLLAEVARAPGDTLTRDSLVFTLDSLDVARLAAADAPGLLLTVEGAAARVQLSRLVLRASVRPASAPDTTVAITVAEGPQTFVFTPDAPSAGDALQVGGLFGPRTVFRVTPPQRVPRCEAGAAACGTVALDSVRLNEAALLFDPLPVAPGFRPIAPVRLGLRVVGEPELGRLAPLGSLEAATSVPARRFLPPTDSAVAVRLTAYLQRTTPADRARTALVLLTEPNARNFGIARFGRSPRLRLVYTLTAPDRTP